MTEEQVQRLATTAYPPQANGYSYTASYKNAHGRFCVGQTPPKLDIQHLLQFEMQMGRLSRLFGLEI